MKINNFGVRAIHAYNQTQPMKKAQKTNESFADKIEISSKAKEMQVSSVYSNERLNKVNELKEQIDNGSYELNARKTAQHMLNFYRG